jgi:hypothetical protein
VLYEEVSKSLVEGRVNFLEHLPALECQEIGPQLLEG